MRKVMLSIALLALSAPLFAFKVDTLSVHSAKMDKDVKVLVFTPKQAKGLCAEACPVIYMLHGHSGDYRSWSSIRKDMGNVADTKGVFFVCPDAKNSWYWDSPLNADSQYETFVASELPAYIDSHYKTLADKRFRAVTGLSMGGHGALYLSFRHPDVFGACGSTSGGLDIRPFPLNWNMSDQLGGMADNMERWNEHTVVNQIGRIKNGDLAIIIDCGEADFFLEVNKDMHKRLLGAGIDHDFTTRPGGHWHTYWANSFDYHVLFFTKFFDNNRKNLKSK